MIRCVNDFGDGGWCAKDGHMEKEGPRSPFVSNNHRGDERETDQLIAILIRLVRLNMSEMANMGDSAYTPKNRNQSKTPDPILFGTEFGGIEWCADCWG